MKVTLIPINCELCKLVMNKTKNEWPYTMLPDHAYAVITKEIAKLMHKGVAFYEAEERIWNDETLIGPLLGFTEDKYEVSLPCTMTLCNRRGQSISIAARYHLYTYQVYSRQLPDVLAKLGTEDVTAVVKFPKNEDVYFCFPSNAHNLPLSHWTICNMNGPLAECLPF